MPRLTDDQWETIRAKRESGASFPELSKEFGISHQAIQKRAKKEGWGAPLPKKINVVELVEVEKRRIARQQEIESITRANNRAKEEAKRIAAASSENQKQGYVYIVECEHKGDKWQKIGRTSDFNARLPVIQTGCPLSVSVIKIGVVKDSVALEGYLHSIFKERKTSGEWFVLDELDIALAIRNIEANAIGLAAEVGAEGKALCLD